MTAGLFRPALPDALDYHPGLFAPEEAGRLMARLVAEVPWEERESWLWGRLCKTPRLVFMYGPVAYTYSNFVHPPCPMPEWIAEIRDRASEASGLALDSVICNFYRHGRDSVSWHSDDDFVAGAHSGIASVSFGASRRLDFRPKKALTPEYQIELETGSLVVMRPGAQRDWLHAVQKLPTAEAAGPRVNLNFRCFTRNPPESPPCRAN